MTIRTETYGRFEIKSGPFRGQWAANAIRHKAIVSNASGASREEAVQTLKGQLDQLASAELATRDAEGAPSATIYEKAFSYLLGDLPNSYMAMLRAHLAAPDQLISATRLAQAAGYAGYEGANLHYGKLGQRVADEIGFDPPKRADGTEIWTCAIARDPTLDTEFPDTSLLQSLERTLDVPHFEWQMRPQVVQALRALGY